MRHITVCLVGLLVGGCATGYGTLAGMGVGMVIGGIGAINTNDASYVGQGAALGALFGVAAAGTASLIAHHEGKVEAQEDFRMQAQHAAETKERDENARLLEAIRQERAALVRDSKRATRPQPSEPPERTLPEAP